jgi:hypothetical protein
MLSLPFMVGAGIAGDWLHVRTLAAALAALSIFLLRTPLLTLTHGCTTFSKQTSRVRDDAKFSIIVYSFIAASSALYLSFTLPLVPLSLLAGGAVLITAGTSHPCLRNRQRSILFQLTGVVVLTSSSLLGYLAAAGYLHNVAFWLWLFFAAQMSVSVFVVHAQLEFAIGGQRPPSRSALAYRRKAAIAEVTLWLALIVVALHGNQWIILAFIPASAFHWWSLRHLGFTRRRISMRKVGITELSTSVVFSLLLLLLL